MAAEFLKGLPVSEEERTQLATFGANSPLTLLNMRRASRDAFDRCFGERAQFIADELEKLLTPEERESSSQAPEAPGRLGARLDRSNKRSGDR
jgi:hypothetical protein